MTIISRHNLSNFEVKELGNQGRYQELEEIVFSYLSLNKTRKYAVKELAKKPEEYIKTLINLLTDYDDEVQIEAMKGIKKLKKKVVQNYDNLILPVLTDVFNSNNERLKREALKLSNRLEDKVRVDLLIDVFEETIDEVLLEEIVINLAEIEDDEVKYHVKNYMESYIINGGRNRCWAIMALGQIKAYDKILLLRRIIKDKNEDFKNRKSALFALEDLKDGRAIGIILKATEDNELKDVAKETIPQWILNFGYQDSMALQTDLESDERDLFISAVFSLDCKEYLKNPDLLLKCLKDQNYFVRDIAECKLSILCEEYGEELVRDNFPEEVLKEI